MEIKLIKEDENGKVYQVNDFKIFYRNKGTISGNNSENVKELIYFVSGSAKVTIGEFVQEIESPTGIEIPAKTYHKIKALTDISFILYEE